MLRRPLTHRVQCCHKHEGLQAHNGNQSKEGAWVSVPFTSTRRGAPGSEKTKVSKQEQAPLYEKAETSGCVLVYCTVLFCSVLYGITWKTDLLHDFGDLTTMMEEYNTVLYYDALYCGVLYGITGKTDLLHDLRDLPAVGLDPHHAVLAE